MNVYDKRFLRELKGSSSLGSSVLLLMIIMVISGLMIWSYITELDVVVRGQGTTISRNSNEMLQTAESGVIVNTFVKEGDLINIGQDLFQLDLIEIKGQIQQINDKVSSLKIRSKRLNAEATGVAYSPDTERSEKELEIIEIEKAVYAANLEQQNSSKAVLKNRKMQKSLEISELEVELISIENNLNLLMKEILVVEPLVASKLAPETRLLGLLREKENLDGRFKAIPKAIERVKKGADEIEEQLAAQDKAFKAEKLNELGSIKMEIDELSSRLPSLKERLLRSSIKSPINGVVNRITFQSDDAFVKAGDVLMEIVPINDELIVEAKIDPKDIAKISLGDKVKISLTAYDASKFGRIDGTVINISADAISDSDKGTQFYQINVSIDGRLEKSAGLKYTILPGMVATIEILAGKRTILDYFWQPVVKSKDAAFRE